MSRELPDWIDSYLEYTENTESAKAFHLWVGISMITSALQKKVHMALGRLKIFPNTYVVLVAEPGQARKSVAIDFGLKIIKEIQGVVTSADAITKEALLQDLESCQNSAIMPDGSSFDHNSMSIISKEFESFLGQRTDNTKMLVLLTDLFDCTEASWNYRTKSSGNTNIASVYVTLLGATTPDSLASSLPPSAIGGGLTSRILFIWAPKKEKKVPIPVETLRTIELRKKLEQDLFHIHRITGTYMFTNDSKEQWIDWYNAYEDLDPGRLCTDTSFNGWYSRKPMYVLKAAQACAASVDSSLEMHWKYIHRAIQLIESVEKGMGNAFKAVGRSTVTAEVDTVLSVIRVHQQIKETELMKIVWRDLDSSKFENVIDTILKTGRVRREIIPTGPQKGILYTYMG